MRHPVLVHGHEVPLVRLDKLAAKVAWVRGFEHRQGRVDLVGQDDHVGDEEFCSLRVDRALLGELDDDTLVGEQRCIRRLVL